MLFSRDFGSHFSVVGVTDDVINLREVGAAAALSTSVAFNLFTGTAGRNPCSVRTQCAPGQVDVWSPELVPLLDVSCDRIFCSVVFYHFFFSLFSFLK